MKNKIYFLLFFASAIVTAQTNVDLRPQIKSPEVNKFEQYMNMPVNLVSGTPQVSIPIYTLEYGGMTLPITLEYDASGVKVESIASSVGQNWSLNVGGVVSRIVKGAPDEGNPYNWQGISTIDVDGYYQDYGLSKLESQLNLFPATPYNPENIDTRAQQFSKWKRDIANGYKDSQPDFFYFNTPQGGCKFVFNAQREVAYLENTDFIVKENFGNNDFKSWLVTSPQGIKYKFGIDNPTGYQGNGNICESSYNLDESIFFFNNNGVELNPIGGLLNRFIVNTWFLTEISNATSNKIIQISYEDNEYKQTVNNLQSTYTDYCYNSLLDGGASVPSSACNDNLEHQYNLFVGTNPVSSTSSYIVHSKVVNQINAGKIKINFTYSLRTDLGTEFDSPTIKAKKLDLIEILENEICVKKIFFNYTHVSSNEVSNNAYVDNYARKRFFLNELIEMSCDEGTIKPYTFIYNLTPLPNRLSYAQDKWGYFNGKVNNNSMFSSYRFLIDDSIFSNRSLDFNYAKAGSLEKIIYPTKGSINFEYEPHSSFDGESPNNVPTDIYYDPISQGNYVTDLAPNTNNSPDPFSTNSSVNSIDFVYNYADEAIYINSVLMFPHPISNITSCGQYSFSSKAVEIIDTTTNQVVASLTYNDVNSAVPKTIVSKKVVYPEDLVVGRTYTCKVYGWGIYGHCLHNMTTLERHKIYPIFTIGGLRIKKNTHKSFDNSISKEVVYTYFKPKVASNPKRVYKIENYNPLQQLNTLNGIISGSNISYINTYLKNERNFEWDNISSHFYFVSSGIDFLDFNFIGPKISYGKVIESDGNGQKEFNFNKYLSYIELNDAVPFLMPSAPKFQSLLAGEKMSEIIRKNNDEDIKTNRNEYNYNITLNSIKGISSLTTYRPPGIVNDLVINSYTLQGQIKTLKSETETTNFNGNIVEVKKEYEYNGTGHYQPTKIKTTDYVGNQLLETRMAYPLDMQTAPNADKLILQNRKDIPLKVETYRGAEKLSEQETQYGNFPASVSPNVLTLPQYVFAKKGNVATNALEKKATYNYDTDGNLVEYKPENGVSTIIVWGYNKTQPIIKIENMALTSLSTTLVNLINSAKTASDLPNNEANVLSALTAVRADSSLANLMVSTYTYKPLIGVSTMTDPKGDRMTYEYDSLNRLKWVKDKNGKILSENQYHYKN